MFYRSQINFALHCSTTALGISIEHLTQGSNLLKAIYRFHVYYHIRRILKRLSIPLSGEKRVCKAQ